MNKNVSNAQWRQKYFPRKVQLGLAFVDKQCFHAHSCRQESLERAE